MKKNREQQKRDIEFMMLVLAETDLNLGSILVRSQGTNAEPLVQNTIDNMKVTILKTQLMLRDVIDTYEK